jgi:chromo domain-containing protein 1
LAGVRNPLIETTHSGLKQIYNHLKHRPLRPSPRQATILLTYTGTWEPEENLLETDLLTPWNQLRARMGSKKFQDYMDKNETLYNEARDAAEALKNQEYSKKQNGSTVPVDEDSDDETSLRQQTRTSPKSPKAAPSHSQEIYNSLFVDSQDPDPLGPPPPLEQSDVGLFVEQPPAVRRPPLDQSTDDEEMSSSADETDDSLLGELANDAKNTMRQKATSRAQMGKEANLGNSILSPKSPGKKAAELPAKPTVKQPDTRVHVQDQPSKLSKPLMTPAQGATPKTKSVQQNDRRLSASAAQVSSTTSKKDNNLVRQKVHVNNNVAPSPTPAVPSATSTQTQKSVGTTTSTSIRRSGLQSKSAIRMTNEPKNHQRKDWQNSEGLYNKLKYRHRADLKSRREGTPDLAALSFVGAGPTGLIKPRVSNAEDNPYGRREAGNRRLQDSSDEECERRDVVETVDPILEWEADKVPLVCPHWRLTNNCFYGEKVCKFLHRNKDEHGRDLPVGDISRSVPPKYRKPPLTCAFWLHSHTGCKKPDAECEYAHRNTGWVPKSKLNKDEPVSIDPNALPVSEQTICGSAKTQSLGPSEQRNMRPSELTCWYWVQNKCRNTSERCIFQHYDTGIVADPPPRAQTCRFWLEGTCISTADECKFQHYNTGFVSGRASRKSSMYFIACKTNVY